MDGHDRLKDIGQQTDDDPNWQQEQEPADCRRFQETNRIVKPIRHFRGVQVTRFQFTNPTRPADAIRAA
jgi:hypothetical protein